MKKAIQSIYDKEYHELINQVNDTNKTIYVFYDSKMVDNQSVYLRVKTKYAALFNVKISIIDLNQYEPYENHKLMQQIVDNKDFLFFELPLSQIIWDQNYFAYLNINNDLDGLYAPQLIDNHFTKIKYHPATIKAILAILNHIPLYQKQKVVVIGRSKYLGDYLYKYLKHLNLRVDLFHSKTKDINKKLKDYDIVISCINQSFVFSIDDLKINSYLIDVTTEILNNKVVGSFTINQTIAEQKNIKYTPVPGGVGKLTTLFLFKNYFK